MTPQDIESIQVELGVTLPPAFIAAGLSGSFQDPLHDSAAAIIGINRSFRSGDFGDEHWNPKLIAFGHDGGGNYFCIDVTDFEAGVFMRDHETYEITKEYDSFDQFMGEWA